MIEPESALLAGWAGGRRARCWVYRPRDVEEVALAHADAAGRGLTVAHRGAGMSYGDAALNEGGAVLQTAALRRRLELDRERGLLHADAGFTVEDVWKATVASGWWPPAAPGTMKATLGGCAAMDVHGKDQMRRGTFGEHLEALTVLEPGGSQRRLSAASDADAFARVVGAQGLTGTILDVTLKLKRLHSGYLEVETWALPSLAAALEVMEKRASEADHCVAWVDCAARGNAAGRALASFATDLPPDHHLAGRGLKLSDQLFPDLLLGVFPRRLAWHALRPLTGKLGLSTLNATRYAAGRARSGRRTLQTHARWHFLLDYIPDWKRVYGPRGFLQYQMFVPRAAAPYAFQEALRLQRAAGLVSTLAVLKAHRAGRFAAPYCLEGYSLALDFPVPAGRKTVLESLCRSLDALLREVGGRIYAAKDEVSRGLLPRHRHPLFSSSLVRRWEMPESPLLGATKTG